MAERPAAPARDDGWAALHTIDWTPRTYEFVAALFGGVVLLLLRPTPLPLSATLAWELAGKGVFTIAAVYAVTCAIVAGRVLLDGARHGVAGLTTPQRLVPLIMPYASLDFFVLTVRRALAVFTAVFFFLHLKHVILWLHMANYDRLLWDLDRWLTSAYSRTSGSSSGSARTTTRRCCSIGSTSSTSTTRCSSPCSSSASRAGGG